ncbi:MAG: GNAT family N-acetyltransferase [Saprospiraceae bacterium]|nr:GNAT family N-acetyltransferase [Saprospiraceae bacterium]
MQLPEKIHIQNELYLSISSYEPKHITQQQWFISLLAEWVQTIPLNKHQYYIPLNKKLGIWHAYIPPFMQKIECAELNLFEAESLLRSLHTKYSCGNICLPQDIDCVVLNIEKSKRNNYILALNKTYEEIYQHYHKGHKLNIKFAQKQEIIISKTQDFQNFTKLYRLHSHKDIPAKYKSADHLNALIKACMDRGHGLIFQAQNIKGEILAACFLSDYKDRYVYHLSFASEEGKEKYAMHAILDQLIKDQANSNKILDFEGSMIPGVAYFMKGFGATEEYYYQYIWNEALLCKIINFARRVKSGIFK